MKFRIWTFVVCLLTSCEMIDKEIMRYPSISKDGVTDTIHGVLINDPYRNLEDLENSDIKKWFREQSALSDSIMGKINNDNFLFKKTIEFEERQKQIIEDFTITPNGAYVYLKREKGLADNNLYYRKSKWADEILLINPNDYKEGYRINYYKPSWDLSKIAVSLAKKGEDASEIVVLSMEDRKLLPDVIKNARPDRSGGIHWMNNNSGFFYLHVPHFEYSDPTYLLNTETRFHRIGKNDESISVFSRKHNTNLKIDPEEFPEVWTSDRNPDMLFARINSDSDFKHIFYADISIDTNLGDLDWKQLFRKKDKIDQFIINGNDVVYRTARNASNYKICRTSLSKMNYDKCEELVSEKTESVISGFEILDDELFYTTRKNGTEAKFFRLDDNGVSHEIDLPYPSGNSSVTRSGNAIYVSVNGWTRPYTLFQYKYVEEVFENVQLSNTDYPEFKEIVVEELEIPSHDGEFVPLSLIYKPNMIRRDGSNRTLIYAYGSYGVNSSPFFYLPFMTWISEGGILAVAHVRGGGEKGNFWHKAGYKTTKENSWKDANFCTEYLISENFTSPDRAIAYSVSAGGIAMGRAVIERPDLYAAACFDVPFFNALRSEFGPNGPNSIKEFGTIKDSSEFRALAAMDVYHNIKNDVAYPATYILTGMKDGTVVPWDPAKVVARLQNDSKTEKPVLLAVDFDGGHLGDGTYRQFYQDMCNNFSFALWQTGHPDYQPK